VVFQNEKFVLEFPKCKGRRGLTKFHNVYNKEGGLLSPLLMVMVVTMGSLGVGVVCVGASQ
jgi:hypothetical protein